jgi:DNA primase
MSQTVTFAQAIEAVKSALDVVTVVAGTVNLRKAGRNYTGLCPFHKEKTPSFSVNREKNLFKCFGCGESGDALTFLMKTTGKTFAEVIKQEAERQGLSIEDGQGLTPEQRAHQVQKKANLQSLLQQAALWFSHQLTPDVITYLKNRHIDQATAQRFGLGHAPAGWDHLRRYMAQQHPDITDMRLHEAGLCVLREDKTDGQAYNQANGQASSESVTNTSGGAYDRFRNRLMIPIYNALGEVVAFGGRSLSPQDMPKYLNSPENPLYIKSQILYGLNWAKPAIQQHHRAIVMEGYFDVMRCHLAGFTEAVASCGTALTREHIMQLVKAGVEKLYLAFDSDAAGQRAILSALNVLDTMTAHAGQVSVRVVQMPEGKDPDEYLLNHPPEAFEALLQSAMPHWQFRCQMAIAGFDMTVMEDRMKATNQLVAVLQQLNHPVLRSEYVRMYAPVLNITEHDLMQYTRQNTPQNPQQGARTQSTSGSRSGSRSGSVSGSRTGSKNNAFSRHNQPRVSDVGQMRQGLKSRADQAEHLFFALLMANNALWQALWPVCQNLPWLSEGALQLCQSLAFMPAEYTLAQRQADLQRDMQSDPVLRHFLTEVQLTPLPEGLHPELLQCDSEFSPLQENSPLLSMVSQLKLILSDGHRRQRLNSLASQIRDLEQSAQSIDERVPDLTEGSTTLAQAHSSHPLVLQTVLKDELQSPSS